MNYRVWHNPQIGSDAGTFYVDVKDIKEGVTVMNALADYDLFQLENNIKPDYSNAQGLQQCEEELTLDDENWEDFEMTIQGWYFDEPEEYLKHIEELKNE